MYFSSRSTLVMLLTAIVLASCSAKKSREQLARLDTNEPNNFIESLADNRKDANSGNTGFSISAKTLFSKGGFHIINFQEISGQDTLAYSILLNPGDPTGIDTLAKSTFASIQQLLNHQEGLTPGLLKGNVDFAADFTGDGSLDFILKYKSRQGKEIVAIETILLYNGQNKLTPIAIHAQSHYDASTPLTGVKENIEWRKDSVGTIYVNHAEDSLGLRPIRYSKTWRWLKKENTWMTGLIAASLDRPVFGKFTKRLTYLETNNGIFTIPENCVTGAPIYFELQRVEPSNLSDFYLIKTGIDDTGYNLVVQILMKDASTYLLVKGRGEKLKVQNPTGEPEIRMDSTDATLTIRNDPNRRDIYWFTYSYSPTPIPYTDAPGKYRVVKCGR